MTLRRLFSLLAQALAFALIVALGALLLSGFFGLLDGWCR